MTSHDRGCLYDESRELVYCVRSEAKRFVTQLSVGSCVRAVAQGSVVNSKITLLSALLVTEQVWKFSFIYFSFLQDYQAVFM